MTNLVENLQSIELKNFKLKTLVIESEVLKANPLLDSPIRYNPVLIPVASESTKLPVVLVLSGFTGNGSKYLNIRFKDKNFMEVLDSAYVLGDVPNAIYVLVDAMTYWGGSQFLNSEGCGRYEDYIMQELCGAIRENFSVTADWCVMGGSSGGYGALHLGSLYPEIFNYIAAIAPDSFFEMSLLPDIYKALPGLRDLGGVKGVIEQLESGKLMKRRDAHSILNCIGMAKCYTPEFSSKEFDLGFFSPVDTETGLLLDDIWKHWKKYDPIVFLSNRVSGLKKIKKVFLDVGTKDQYNLQYGTRQIRDILIKQNVDVDYSEFNGTHFDIGERRVKVWKWLKKNWG